MPKTTKKLFKFNLLPGMTADEVRIENQRDSSTFYAFSLVAFASFVYLIIVLLQALVLEPRLLSLRQQLAQRQQVELGFAAVRAAHGELFIKTKTLKPVLEKNIDTSEIFRVAQEIRGGRPDIIVESYNRERTGEFVFLVLTPVFTDSSLLLDNAAAAEGVTDVFVRSVVRNESSGVIRTTISLIIEAA